MAEKKEYTEAALLEMLQNTYKESDGHCVLTHVHSDTGGGAGIRTADAISMGLWKSRGRHLTGYEVKVSRNDWMKELDNPAKADEIGARCDYWYIIAPPGLVSVEELPEGWGLLEPARTRLKIIKKAVKNDNPDPLTRGFVASILRQFLRQKSDRAAVNEARHQSYWKGVEAGKQEAMTGGDRGLKSELKDLENYKAAFKKFQEETGISMWGPIDLRAIAQAVKWAHEHGHRFFQRLELAEDRVNNALLQIQEARTELKGLDTRVTR